MRSTIGIEINASPDLVFRLARDVRRWEVLLPHYVRSRAVGSRPMGSRPARTLAPTGDQLDTLVAFVARRPLVGWLGLGVPVAWRARTWSVPDGRQLRFVHVAGATKGMDVTWHIEPAPVGCRVTIEHRFAPRLPGFARFVDRFFTGPIAGRTLATFKALAEALADEAAADVVEPRPAAVSTA
jgi:ribosome-associated toxin RatA of RatAB toxin-antitoxin module